MQHQDHTTRFTQLSSRRDLLRTAGAAGLALATGAAWAQGASGWPSKPVNLIVPFPAGGGTDAFARPLAAQFSKSTGKTLVIDNRGGAGGTVGASAAAKAPADGYYQLACSAPDRYDPNATVDAVADFWVASKLSAFNGDIEDNLIMACAERAKADYIVTRDKGLLRRSTVCALAPEDATALLRARG